MSVPFVTGGRTRAAILLGALLLASLAVGCTTTHQAAKPPAASGTASAAPATAPPVTTSAARPFTVHIPPDYVATRPSPLLIMLHGYTASGALEEAYLRLAPVAAAHGMLYVYPDGTVDKVSERFWNATDACCNLFGSAVDDSSYLSGMIDQIEAGYDVDRHRIFIIGHSNGGFMAYRMACDHADQIAAIVSLEAATFADPARCQPSQPVSVLEVHGTADPTIVYDGRGIVNDGHLRRYPSAPTTVKIWATYDGCRTIPDSPEPSAHDIEQGLPPATVVSYSTGCKPGGHAELWTEAGGVHVPVWSATFDEQIIDFLVAHPKP